MIHTCKSQLWTLIVIVALSASLPAVLSEPKSIRAKVLSEAKTLKAKISVTGKLVVAKPKPHAKSKGVELVNADPAPGAPSDGVTRDTSVYSQSVVLAMSLLRQGKPFDAAVYLEFAALNRPEATMHLPMLVDSYVDLGALADAATILRGSKEPFELEQERTRLRRAYIFAKLGQLTPGLERHCFEFLKSRTTGFPDGSAVSWLDVLPQRDQGIVIAAVAIAKEAQGYSDSDVVSRYCAKALTVDPTNPLACMILASDYHNLRKDYKSAVKFLERGIGRAEGRLRGTMEGRLKDARSLGGIR